MKKGYHKTSLKCHPDRVGEENKIDATKKFQTLGKVYSVLSDKEARAVYDETGGQKCIYLSENIMQYT